ncbi:hypothetical protein B0H19DRAFT_1244084, partial [Mycena capillaripes]
LIVEEAQIYFQTSRCRAQDRRTLAHICPSVSGSFTFRASPLPPHSSLWFRLLIAARLHDCCHGPSPTCRFLEATHPRPGQASCRKGEARARPRTSVVAHASGPRTPLINIRHGVALAPGPGQQHRAFVAAFSRHAHHYGREGQQGNSDNGSRCPEEWRACLRRVF